MTTEPISYTQHLVRSKGPRNALRRFQSIVTRVGLTPAAMRQTLDAFADLLTEYGVSATFPTPAQVVERHPQAIHHLVSRRIEIAVHGDAHRDLSRMTPEAQAAALERATERFRMQGIPFVGFRAPYLQWNQETRANLARLGFWYDASQALLWDVVDLEALQGSQRQAYERVLDFYQPWSAEEHPSLPFWDGDLLIIPISLPDDEMLVDRLHWTDQGKIAATWLEVLHQSHAKGELFVLQLHPERFGDCRNALRRVIAQAQGLQPAVWIASLQDICRWWRTRREIGEHVPGWPGGAASALAITGDLDSLTWWDYASRAFTR